MTLFRRRHRGLSEATKSREQTERDLEYTKAQTPKYVEFARSFIEIQEVNHLGQTAARVLRGERP